MLYAKFASGLFDKPLPDTLEWRKAIHTAEAKALARRMADESTVLLTNKDGFLPLSADGLGSIAVIGPNADRVQFGDYSWSADKSNGVTPLDGLKSMLAPRGVRINYAEGCDPYSQDKSGFKAAIKAARKSDVILLFVGSQSAILARASEPTTSGEGYDLTDLTLPGVQMDLIRELSKLGKPMVVTMVISKPFVADEIAALSESVLVQWYARRRSRQLHRVHTLRRSEPFRKASCLISEKFRPPSMLLQLPPRPTRAITTRKARPMPRDAITCTLTLTPHTPSAMA